MMVLTVRQPLATMAVHQFKRLDGRAWATTYRGPVALYAPKSMRGMTRGEFLRFCLDEPFRGPLYRELKIDTCFRLPRGHIVGTAELVGVERLDANEDMPPYPEIAMGGYGPLCCIWHRKTRGHSPSRYGCRHASPGAGSGRRRRSCVKKSFAGPGTYLRNGTNPQTTGQKQLW